MIERKYILYVDDLENQISFKALFRRKFPIFTVSDLTKAKEIVSRYPIKILLYNQSSSALNAEAFLNWIKNYDTEIVRILIFGSRFLKSENSQNNPQKLAHHCLYKPWKTKEMESVLSQWWDSKNQIENHESTTR